MRRVPEFRHFFPIMLPLLCLIALRADDIPVAPIPPVEQEDGGIVYALQSDVIGLTVSPREGGITSIRTPGVPEWLAAPLRLTPGTPDPEGEWRHRAWRTHEGSQIVMLTRGGGNPHNLRVVHLIELSSDGARLEQITRFHSTGPAHAPVIPRFETALPLSANVWAHSPDTETDGCGGWTLHGEEQSDTGYLAVELDRDIAFLQSRWTLEDEAPPLRATGNVEFEPERKTLGRAPELPDLPAQGWTLTHLLRLNVDSRPEKQSVCDFLTLRTPGT